MKLFYHEIKLFGIQLQNSRYKAPRNIEILGFIHTETYIILPAHVIFDNLKFRLTKYNSHPISI